MAPSVRQFIDAGEAVEIIELDKSGVVQRRWIHEANNSISEIDTGSRSSIWRTPLKDSFLPVGFPNSVSPDYLAYQAFDSLQAFFSTIVSLLASRALLEGLGVGDAATTATFALLLTIVRDGVARVATIAFAHRFGLAIEPEARYYRFLADLFNDAAFFLDLVSPHVGPLGKFACLATGEAMRAVCGVAAGASKAALSAHFARQDNLAELNAKEASQETAVGLLGLLVGTVVVRYVEDRAVVFWLMVVLVFGHLLMNYLGVRCVTLRTLNRQRASIVFQDWCDRGEVPTPADVAAREAIVRWMPVFCPPGGGKSAATPVRISFAGNYADAMCGLVTIIERPRFSLHVCSRGRRPRSSATTTHLVDGDIDRSTFDHIKILVREDAAPLDVAMAWFLAMEFATSPSGGVEPPSQSSNPKLLQQLEQKGWDLSSSAFETSVPTRLRVVKHEYDVDKKDK